MSLEKTLPSLTLGRYRHYKGGEYQVYGVGWHSETEEAVVIYRPLYGAGELWVRPFEMFVEDVEFKGKKLPRFELIEPGQESLA